MNDTALAAVPSGPAATVLRVVVPVVAGVAVAIALGTQGDLAPLIMLCAVIYLFAAAIGKRWGAWVGFAASFLVLAPGFLLHNPWIPIGLLVIVQIVLIIIGYIRGAWRDSENRLQLWGSIAFSALAIVAVAGVAPWAGILTVVGLLGHAVWDFWHHHSDRVVTRSYALFCGALDLVLALLVGIAVISSAA